MLQRLKLFGLYTIYWLAFFVFARLFFLLYSSALSFDIPIKEWFLIFIHGFKLDISATGYIMAIISFVLMFTSYSKSTFIRPVFNIVTFLFLFFSLTVVVSDAELYRHWGYRMDATPLLYILKPKEAMASVEVWLTIILVISILALLIFWLIIYSKIITKALLKIERNGFQSIILFLIITAFMIIPVRGGIGIAPMNTGKVYFSKNNFSNHAAINVVWNVVHSLIYKNNLEKNYEFMNTSEAEKIVSELNYQNGKNSSVLKNNRPNIVIIILESFSSKVVESLEGKWPVAKNLNQLAKEGILFTNFYANADRSDKGIVSILSGYPAQPMASIIKFPKKTQTLPFINQELEKSGYESCFYYGGDIDFANMRSYFINAGFDKIISDKNFESKYNTSKWGVHDEHMFDKLYSDIQTDKQPFFKSIFTLSSHDPFEVPGKTVIEGNDRASKYLNSIHYSDSCLGDFFTKIKKTETWNNTLFILVADHGSGRPGNNPIYAVDKYKIPMLWIGGALKDSAFWVNTYGSQTDIAKTLLNQMGIESGMFSFSKDIFNNSGTNYGYYVYNDGFAFINDSATVVFDNSKNGLLFSNGINTEEILLKGKALLQITAKDYLNR
ncbi:MAG: hypothetical protein A2X13_08345 [Bacteroidetes bacterium GWC2_33_15]|nr:MAG: hypothetical protein A2X10_10175 [Bacteroidetes bacterium GWA2_33_15]OFX51464.1 MAG: hypothetical protein A2X13_08345 [Bacteroidetes bacterium GWC2_33_15]OFX65790.1 MAG: hypothetical protein A2X15_13435 [Bacteroidetes bacterium GWB2_32_14]OFX69492.1 MAG: hypothetical protein A2X14_09925 [Bacteroidetes bacterium GWD2_33_33]HAN17749.1 sulfatase [Bacteroidales bacterium]